tara:strand:+ start:2530 stop:3351 length:822 start_codon:yes stop_codon:yes gene_type:complete
MAITYPTPSGWIELEMNLENITPLILTFNEQDNLRGTLAGLHWAQRIVVVDSGSTDETLAIAAEFDQVCVVTRRFDHFADQCNFGLQHVETEWVLSLDADYRCSDALAQEIAECDGDNAGYEAAFRYAIYGKLLSASLYPPRVVLYRKASAEYHRDGHAHRVQVIGPLSRLEISIIHDDRKPLSTWFTAQLRYANAEATKLSGNQGSDLGWKDRLRKKIVFAPLLTPAYCLFVKRLIFDGWAGIFYTLQRTFAELTLSLVLLDRFLQGQSKPD